MGIYQRDYMRPGFQGGSRSSGPRSWSVVTWLIVINVGVFVLQWMIARDYFLLRESNGEWLPRGGLSWGDLKSGSVWTLFTYMFVHGSMWHLAGNILGLFFLGRTVLTMLGNRHFLVIYFGGGLLGAVASLSLIPLYGVDIYLIGASGGVIAIVIALAALKPEEEVILIPFPVRFKLKTLALIFVSIDLITLFGDLTGLWESGIGSAAHLGGALFGWFYVQRGLSGTRRQTQSADQAYRWLQKFDISKVLDAEMTEPAEKKKSWFKSSKPQPYISASVDEILEKISAQGMQSLTDEERKILEKSSEKLAKMTNRTDGK